MLVLTRKEDETIDFTVPPSDKPTELTVKVVRIKGNTTRIGIDAPREVEIRRGELDKLPDGVAKPLEAPDTDA